MAKSQEHPNRTRDIKSGQESRHDGRAVMQPEQRAKVAFHSVAAESLYRILFSIGHKVGFHITRNNFYSPLPDTRNLPATLWSKTSDLLGVNLNEERQLGRLDIFESQFRKEYKEFPREATPIPFQYHVNNHAFESVDGELLYCMIRHFKPRRFLEIGSGNSTFLAAQAILKNVSEDPTNSCDLTAVDPFSSQVHQQGFPGLSTVLRCGVQELPFSRFEQLEPNDILFIDSSHILKIGSDVQYLFLEVLPRLPKGVVVHVHDIFLPAEYPKEWILKKIRFWNEQYLLQSFLTFNDFFEVLWAGNFMHLKHPGRLEKAFPSYSRENRRPGSFWMQRIK